MILFIAGLPGAGKSTVGELVASELGWEFTETDDFLTEEMVDQIRRGEMLTSEQLNFQIMRKVIPHVVELEKRTSLVVAGFLAEKEFVDTLSEQSSQVVFINLDAPYRVLKERVVSRDHFAKKEILDQCWEIKDTLILPGVTVDSTRAVDIVVHDIVSLFLPKERKNRK